MHDLHAATVFLQPGQRLTQQLHHGVALLRFFSAGLRRRCLVCELLVRYLQLLYGGQLLLHRFAEVLHVSQRALQRKDKERVA